MVNLVFTGIARQDPAVYITETGNTIATFAVDVRELPHLPPTRVDIVAIGKQGIYAQQVIKKDSLVLVAGWFCVEQKRGNDYITVKAKHLRALII
jgi:hypothetical protein